MQEGAEVIASQLRARRGSREQRRTGRALLAEVFQALPSPGDEAGADEAAAAPGDAQAPAAEHAALAHRLSALARALAAPATVWPTLTRRPFPERFMRPVSAARAERIAGAAEGHFSVNLALSDARITWMEERCQAAAPGLLKPIRQPERGQGERLTGSELELLRKRGRSKFS